jgi:CelD/BcsL family acetyltransferase involved in cellulose biosynthesis
MGQPLRLRSYDLRYQLSDQPLFSKRLQVLARQFSLRENLDGKADAAAYLDALPDGTDGYLFLSISGEQLPQGIFRLGDYIGYVLIRQPRYYADLSTDFPTYVSANFSSKTRATIQRKVRKAKEHCGGAMQCKAYRTPEQLREFHDLARTISRHTYQERLFDAGLPEDEGFVAGMLHNAAQDQVRAFLLFWGDTPVSYLYLDVIEDTLIYSYLGYLPQYRDWSVGVVLQWLALESLFEEKRFRAFDFTEGAGENKKLFSSGATDCANLLLLRRTWFHRLLVRSHWLTERFSRRAGDLFRRWGLKTAIKRLIRRGFTASWRGGSDDRSP